MSRMKSIFAVLVLAAMVGIVPQAHAQVVKVVIAGSSAMWQAMGIGAYNGGTSPVAGGGATSHWTSASNKVNLTDTRPSPVNNDPGTVWVVWDSAVDSLGNPNPNVWVYLKVDSVVGDRCYFAHPRCNLNALLADISTGGANQISSTLLGGTLDTTMPTSIQSLFTSSSGLLVNTAATDIRPEDAAFAECRVNSVLGASAAGGGASDGTDGLGYGTKAAGVCPVLADSQAAKLGTPIKSGLTASTAQANVLAFNISGTDPFTNTIIPAFTVVSVGAAPIVFITERDKGQLGSLTNASETQLQAVFSGTNCDASAFGLPAGAINIFLREPLSGTMNTTEANLFRRPTVYPNPVLGLSQELNVGLNNPLKNQAGTCLAGAGARYRGIGTGEVVKGVLHSGDGTQVATISDGIAYAFFSYGNVSSISNNPNYGYITLNGIDPIFQTYGSTIDPAQPASAGTLPAAANLPVSCGAAFPCSEHNMWANGFSYPNLRNGTYRAWSVLRLVSDGAALTNAKALVAVTQKGVVNIVPDYVPAAVVAGTTDLGLKLVRSHYQQKQGTGANLGAAPINTGVDKGGDMGGYVIPTLIGLTTSKETQLIQSSNSDSSNLGPALRP